MRHVIQKQVIDLVLDSSLDPFTMQHRISQFNQQKILNVLERVFDDLFPGSEVVMMDKLEIDLGILAGKKIEQNKWDIELESIIYEQVNKAIQHKSSKPILHKESREIHLGRQWLFYMEHGYLPWNARPLNADDYAQILEVFAVDYKLIEQLKWQIRTNPRLRERIVLQNPSTFLVALAEIISTKKHDKLIWLVNELYEVRWHFSEHKGNLPALDKTKFDQRVWNQILQIASVQENLTTEMIGHQLVALFFSKDQIIEVSQSKTLQAKLEISKAAWKIDQPEIDISSGKSRDMQAAGKRTAGEAKKIQIEEGGIFVSNGGLVLLHPFLHSYFKLVELIVDNKFHDIDAQIKALHLLYYLSTGQANPEEHELVVAKILTGYPLEEPVPKDIDLKEIELTEADHLLDVVISEWSILQNTSRNGLREGFLQRPGKIFSRNDNLYLQLEASSIDVLLDHLPWNLTMIKLPWMNEILRVEWR